MLGGASIKDASKDAEVTCDDYTSWEGWQRLVRYHVAELRSAEAAEAEAGTTKHYAKAAEQAAKAAQLASAAAAEASSSAAKAAASSKKVTVKELTGKKMIRGQAPGAKKLAKLKKRVRAKAYKTACVQYAEVKEAGGLTAQQVCDTCFFLKIVLEVGDLLVPEGNLECVFSRYNDYPHAQGTSR